MREEIEEQEVYFVGSHAIKKLVQHLSDRGTPIAFERANEILALMQLLAEPMKPGMHHIRHPGGIQWKAFCTACETNRK